MSAVLTPDGGFVMPDLIVRASRSSYIDGEIVTLFAFDGPIGQYPFVDTLDAMRFLNTVREAKGLETSKILTVFLRG